MAKAAKTTTTDIPPGGAGGGEGGGGDGGGEGGGGEGGGGEGADTTKDVVCTSVTEVTLTPRLAERWAVLFAPLSTDITDWEAGRSGTIMVA